MQHASVFLNDAVEVARAVECMPNKGPIYAAFRYDQQIPDILACEGDAYSKRSQYLAPAIENMRLERDEISKDLMALFDKHSRSSSTDGLDLKTVFTLYGFDLISKAAFNYELGAVSGSEEGRELLNSLNTLAEVQSGQGIVIVIVV